MTMKRDILLLTILCLSIVAGAQKPSLNKAYNLYYDKDFVKAKEAIDMCIQDPKLSTKSQTWLYKGNIYYYLASQEYGAKQKDATYQILFPDAPIEAYDAFVKSKSLDANAEAMDMFSAKEAIPQLYPLLLVRGVDQLIAKDFPSAKATLEKGIASYEMDKPKYPMKGDLYYYYAYTLESMGDTSDQVRRAYSKAIADGSTNPYVFVRLMESYKREHNVEAATQLLQQARKSLPNDINIRITEIDYCYWMGDSVKAKSLLNTLPVNDIKDPDAIVNVSNFFIKDKNYEKAVELLSKANVLNPRNFVVLYNLGVCTYSLSEESFNLYNKMAVNSQNSEETKSMKAKSDNYLMQSEEYFEQARVIEPNDLNLLYTLRAIYARQSSSKYSEIDNAIKTIEHK